MKKVYCIRCKSATANSGKVSLNKASNGRHFASVKCRKCGTKKTKFLSDKQVKDIKKNSGGFIPAILAGLALSKVL